MTNVLARIVTDYFTGHTNRQVQRVQFLLFGFSERPWIARVGYVPGGPTVVPVQVRAWLVTATAAPYFAGRLS